tara:strand:- start:265 stop:1785 length:1521 start_codon:yes stop_codon:yes gene_type:complete
MRVIIQKNYNDVVHWAGNYVIQKINLFKPTPDNLFVLGLPTGSTPIGLYNYLVSEYKKGHISFRNVVTFNMDEYIGLSGKNKDSYAHYMHKHFFSKIDILPENINLLNGKSDNPAKECEEYEKKIREMGVNLFIAGLGADGHIAFNEPLSSLKSMTRVKTLHSETIEINKQYFEESSIPIHVMTVGVDTVLHSKEIVMLVSGSAKSNALHNCIECGINHLYSGSALQQHKNAMVICDDQSTLDLSMKTVNYIKNIQEKTDIYGNVCKPDIEHFINKSDKIIVFSPHPDDDVIGLGGTLQKFIKNNVKIVFMTDGSGGYNKTKYKENPRKIEAYLALKTLGYSKDNIDFLSLPFYLDKKNPNKEDYDVVQSYINKFNPEHIFVCNDVDPNKTHSKCYEIIRNSLIHTQLNSKIWLYKSAWGNWNSEEADCVSKLTNEQFNLKKVAIKMHDSQDPPEVFYSDNRPFYDKLIDNNTCVNYCNVYLEKFSVVSVTDYIKMKINLGLIYNI